MELVIATDTWELLPPAALRPVAREKVPLAVSLLEDREWLPLDPDQVAELTTPSPCQPSQNRTAFLLRGVAHGGIATYSLVRASPDLGWIAVYHGTYNGENLLLSAGLQQQVPLPIVAYLPEPPARSFAIAELGGDRLAARSLRFPALGECPDDPDLQRDTKDDRPSRRDG